MTECMRYEGNANVHISLTVQCVRLHVRSFASSYTARCSRSDTCAKRKKTRKRENVRSSPPLLLFLKCFFHSTMPREMDDIYGLLRVCRLLNAQITIAILFRVKIPIFHCALSVIRFSFNGICNQRIILFDRVFYVTASSAGRAGHCHVFTNT